MRRVGYTAGTDEARQAIIARLPHKYEMELNQTDMTWLIEGLFILADSAEESDVSEWAASFASTIAETVGVEML